MRPRAHCGTPTGLTATPDRKGPQRFRCSRAFAYAPLSSGGAARTHCAPPRTVPTTETRATARRGSSAASPRPCWSAAGQIPLHLSTCFPFVVAARFRCCTPADGLPASSDQSASGGTSSSPGGGVSGPFRAALTWYGRFEQPSLKVRIFSKSSRRDSAGRAGSIGRPLAPYRFVRGATRQLPARHR